jgi:SAM-dependent methyltransferase
MSQFGGYEEHAFVAELYDLVPTYATRGDLQFYLDEGRAADGQVLELGCGTGRVLIPMAREGCTITGLDLSPYMLAKCRKKLQLEPPEVQGRVTLVQASMTDFDLGQQYALATIPFRPFQHLVSVQYQLDCLRCIHRHLQPGGRLVFDVFQVIPARINTPRPEEVADTPELALPDGGQLRRTNRTVATHRTEQYNDVEMIFYLTDREGVTQRLVQGFPMRYFFRYEVEHLLARCGFKIVDLYGNFDRSPLGDMSPEMIFVAEKSEPG